MSRARSLVFLNEPFVFVSDDVSVSQDETMREWTEKYLGFAQYMGFHADVSCADPSRLMYLPSRPGSTAQDDYPIFETEGGYLDLSKVETVARSAYQKDKFAVGLSNLGGDSSDFKTPGLLKFVAKYGGSFRISEFFAHAFPDEFRFENDGKHTFTCPNDDEHSNAGDPEDAAFFCTDGDGDKGFYAHCQHAGCDEASGRDRVWYLDKACQRAQISDASALEQYADEAVAEQEVVAEQAEHRTGLKKDSPSSEIREALRGVAAMDILDQDTALREIKDKTGKTLPVLTAALRGVVEEQAEPEADVSERIDPKTYDGPIQITWPFDLLMQLVEERIKRKNRENPRVFMEPQTGAVLRVLDEDDTVRLARLEQQNQWAAFLVDSCNFVNAEGESVAVPPALKEVCSGKQDWDFNRLDRITNVPQMGRDHVMHYTEGYKPSIRSYMRPNVKFPPLPLAEATEEVWTQEVSDALNLLFGECVRDFPFCDYEMEDIQKPIKLETEDADGHPHPNLSRGKGSRTNFLAMVLQGFIRPALGTCCPAYHIDKAAAGTGAGYLANVASYILTGSAARPINVGRGDEELHKMVTSELREYPQITFLDNINHKLDSPALATAITAGEWRARLLGASTMATLPVKTIWIVAGNNISFTQELVRRMVPINMDAKCDQPARDRGRTDFKYDPLDSWLAENRGALVRACLILIANWARGGAIKGDHIVNSFSEWSAAMSGIMKAADIATKGDYQLSESFLSNLDEYNKGHREGADDDKAIIQCLWDAVGTEEFTSDVMLRVYRENENLIDLSAIKLMSGDDKTNMKQLTAQVSKTFKGRWSTLENGKRVILKREKVSNRGVVFKLVPQDETSLS
jgi:hypothetical protein